LSSDTLFQELGLAIPTQQALPPHITSCCDTSSNDTCCNPSDLLNDPDPTSQVTAFSCLPHITLRLLLAALQRAGITGVRELCEDLNREARLQGPPEMIESWTLPRQLFEKWPVLSAVPMGTRD
jgi:hypothetical protein